MFELFEIEPDIKDIVGAPELNVQGAEVAFNNVSFSYGDRMVLRNVSFTIPPGQVFSLRCTIY